MFEPLQGSMKHHFMLNRFKTAPDYTYSCPYSNMLEKGVPGGNLEMSVVVN